MWVISITEALEVGNKDLQASTVPVAILGSFDQKDEAEMVAEAFHEYCAVRSQELKARLLCTAIELTDLTSNAKADMIANGETTYAIDFTEVAEQLFGNRFEVKFDIDFDSVL